MMTGRASQVLAAAAVLCLMAGRLDAVAEGEGHPLPLASSWNTGSHTAADQYCPQWQMDMIDEGHHLLPCFSFRGPGAGLPADDFAKVGPAYYEEPIRRAAELRLPITLVSTQWESYLYRSEEYFSIPAEDSPCQVTAEGEVKNVLSPFGPVKWWRKLGREWTDCELARQLQEWYPDPPFVIFLSNNEAHRLRWHQLEDNPRYLALHGEGRSDDFKRQVVGDGWIERYGAFMDAMRDGLGAWSDKAVFVGYGGVSPHMGRWGQWQRYSLGIPGRLEITPHVWGGCSGSYYVNDWQGNSDGWTGYCPQVSFMNVTHQLRYYHQVNPDFWWEMSTWFDPKWQAKMLEKGQELPPERYRAFVTFGMWLTRPRVVRHFVGWHIKREANWHLYEQVVLAVDQVHAEPSLAEFWRRGELVPNTSQEHPFQSAVPEELAEAERWYALNTSLDPWRPHDVAPAQTMNLEFRVRALAVSTGEEPGRRWLVFAHAPLGDEPNVRVEVPGWGEITMDVARRGSYFVIDEASGAAHSL